MNRPETMRSNPTEQRTRSAHDMMWRCIYDITIVEWSAIVEQLDDWPQGESLSDDGTASYAQNDILTHEGIAFLGTPRLLTKDTWI